MAEQDQQQLADKATNVTAEATPVTDVTTHQENAKSAPEQSQSQSQADMNYRRGVARSVNPRYMGASAWEMEEQKYQDEHVYEDGFRTFDMPSVNINNRRQTIHHNDEGFVSFADKLRDHDEEVRQEKEQAEALIRQQNELQHEQQQQTQKPQNIAQQAPEQSDQQELPLSEEMLQSLHDSAYTHGFQEGRDAARQEFEREKTDIRQQIYEELYAVDTNDLLHKLSHNIYQHIELLLNAERDRDVHLLTLMLEILRKILPGTLAKNGSAEIESFVHEIIGLTRHNEPLDITLPKYPDAELTKQVLYMLRGKFDSDEKMQQYVKISEDSKLGLSDCIVRWQSGMARRDIDELWGDIERILSRHMWLALPEFALYDGDASAMMQENIKTQQEEASLAQEEADAKQADLRKAEQEKLTEQEYIEEPLIDESVQDISLIQALKEAPEETVKEIEAPTETDTKTEAEAKMKANIKAEMKAEAEMEAKIRAEIKAEAEIETLVATETEAQANKIIETLETDNRILAIQAEIEQAEIEQGLSAEIASDIIEPQAETVPDIIENGVIENAESAAVESNIAESNITESNITESNIAEAQIAETPTETPTEIADEIAVSNENDISDSIEAENNDILDSIINQAQEAPEEYSEEYSEEYREEDILTDLLQETSLTDDVDMLSDIAPEEPMLEAEILLEQGYNHDTDDMTDDYIVENNLQNNQQNNQQNDDKLVS